MRGVQYIHLQLVLGRLIGVLTRFVIFATIKLSEVIVFVFKQVVLLIVYQHNKRKRRKEVLQAIREEENM